MRAGLLASLLALLTNFCGAEDLRHHGAITGIVPVDGGMLVSSQSGIFFHSHENADAQPTRAFARPDFRVQSMALAPDGALFAAGGIPGESAMVARFSADAPARARTLPARKDLAYGIAVAPDGRQIAVAHSDGSVMAAQTGDLRIAKWRLRHKHTAPALAVAFSPDGSLLASCGLDGVVLVSSVSDIEREPRIFDDHSAGVECLTFSPDGQFIASGARDSKVRVHESATGRLIRTYSGLGMEVEPVAGRVVARVPALFWGDSGFFAGTSKGTVYRLSEKDDGRTLLSTGPSRGPVTALTATANSDDHVIAAAAGSLLRINATISATER